MKTTSMAFVLGIMYMLKVTNTFTGQEERFFWTGSEAKVKCQAAKALAIASSPDIVAGCSWVKYQRAVL